MTRLQGEERIASEAKSANVGTESYRSSISCILEEDVRETIPL